TATNGETDLNQTFTTVQPNVLTNAYLAPLDGATVGVGQSIALKLDSVPTDRKAVQDAISIKTEPKVDGAFYWISNTEVRWRPENYWKPGTTVTVDAKLRGVDLATACTPLTTARRSSPSVMTSAPSSTMLRRR